MSTKNRGDRKKGAEKRPEVVAWEGFANPFSKLLIFLAVFKVQRSGPQYTAGWVLFIRLPQMGV